MKGIIKWGTGLKPQVEGLGHALFPAPPTLKAKAAIGGGPALEGSHVCSGDLWNNLTYSL